VEAHAGASEEGGEHEPHWGYAGEAGPEHWAALSPEFALCTEGREQSPIDLSGAEPVAGRMLARRISEELLSFEQRTRVLDLVDNGHTIQITTESGMALDLEGEHYELVQYHLHAPSEHTVDGKHAPLEVHFVHKSAGGRLAVLGLLVEEGAHDPNWAPVIDALPSGPGDDRHLENLPRVEGQLHPLSERYYRYRGSLTTPPCSEGVEWIVMAEPHRVSADQLEAIASHLHDNYRPVQPLGQRRLLLVSGE
jgi:carbonic anhydrase